MGNEREGPDSESTDADDDPSQRDLGLGHPLSPGDSTESEDSADPEPADGGSGSTGEHGEPAGEEAKPDTEGMFTDGDGSGVSRRGLLFGGAAGAVAASLGWAGMLTVGDGSPDGAAGVAVELVNAIADNDWEAAGGLYYEGSEFGQQERSYESFLSERGQLERYRSLTPSVEDHYTGFHVPDIDAAVEADDEFTLPGDTDPTEIEELKQIIVMASVGVENLGLGNQTDYFANTVVRQFRPSLVRDENGWQILRFFGVF